MEKQLNNQTAIITGASAGMGKAIALLFAKEGANVVLVDLRKEEIDEVINLIKAQGGKAVGVVCDVSIESDIKKMFDTTISTYNSVDILVNNAGVMDDFLPIEKMSNEHWNRVMKINVDGPFFACRLAVPLMLQKGKGTIINIASIGGLFGSRAGIAYTTSKHALIGFTKNLGFTYAKQGIKCNAIAPGGVNTNIGKNMKPDPFGYERCVSGAGSMPRMGESEEIASIALFLATNDSSFINGSVITADGGWTAY
jgi:NAD(P)-dependent dehydrogenase (short-subunit alcohol dehydrogenase family)